jgi:hypothetical protein
MANNSIQNDETKKKKKTTHKKIMEKNQPSKRST